MADSAAKPVVVPPKRHHRSPAYPAISLSQAIKRAEEFYAKERRNPASFNAAAVHWGYKPTSSGALLAAAALKSYGLLDELETTSGGRTFKVSELGLRIVADKRPDSKEREAAIKEAALKPKIHAEIWRKYNGSLPSDTELSHRLDFDWHFNENSIPVFLKVLRDTISFAKLNNSDNISDGGEDSSQAGDDLDSGPKIGDYIQWESLGMLRLPEAKRLQGFSEDGQFAFVEGSDTGIPSSEIIPAEPPAHEAPKPPTLLRSGGRANMQHTGTPNTSDTAQQVRTALGVVSPSNAWTWTLSMPRNVKAELRIAGEVTKADIARLKKQIEFLEESFEDGTEQ
ncbi:MAG TPA: hypothetical protein VG759_01765 [Candidatus Angelobacter sp.]|jgi:hypothetical protein|nr:hypothetical protein [Candidatus Angelobacter sp.]